jgi:hypothetical protein
MRIFLGDILSEEYSSGFSSTYGNKKFRTWFLGNKMLNGLFWNNAIEHQRSSKNIVCKIKVSLQKFTKGAFVTSVVYSG